MCRSPAPGGHKGGRSPGRGERGGGLAGLGEGDGVASGPRCRGAREGEVRAGETGARSEASLFLCNDPHACFARVAKPCRRGTMWPRDEKENHFPERVPLI